MLLEIREVYEPQILQSGTGKADNGGNSLFLPGVQPPLSQKLIQLFIDRRFSGHAAVQLLRCTHRLRHAWSTTASLALIRFGFQPLWHGRANIAVAAGLPLESFAEEAAELSLPAHRGLHETLDVMGALPGALLLGM